MCSRTRKVQREKNEPNKSRTTLSEQLDLDLEPALCADLDALAVVEDLWRVKRVHVLGIEPLLVRVVLGSGAQAEMSTKRGGG